VEKVAPSEFRRELDEVLAGINGEQDPVEVVGRLGARLILNQAWRMSSRSSWPLALCVQTGARNARGAPGARGRRRRRRNAPRLPISLARGDTGRSPQMGSGVPIVPLSPNCLGTMRPPLGRWSTLAPSRTCSKSIARSSTATPPSSERGGSATVSAHG
jgi:PHD/YefM family antitoxin component YafN of YafNO toxin-antitoxin module